MSLDHLRYDPDGWSHDLRQWWAPLARLAAGADVTAGDWQRVLGIEEFFDQGLLGQTQVLTSWVCVAAAAVAAGAARAWARTAAQNGMAAGPKADAGVLAAGSLEMAMALQRLRWEGRRVGEGLVSTRVLRELGRAALKAGGFPSRVQGRSPGAVWLLAGWLAHSGSEPPAALAAEFAGAGWPAGLTAQQALARTAQAVLGRRAGASALDWGVAHLAERLAAGETDDLGAAPAGGGGEACANVLLAPGGRALAPGEIGLFEARRQRSLLGPPPETPLPDLARLAFLHADDEFAGSIRDAFTAACRFGPPAGPGELVTWALHVPASGYPLAERVVRGPSASLGAYVAFRSLADPRISADDSVAFTGEVAPDGTLGMVGGASQKIAAARDQRIRVIVQPPRQAWRDPSGVLTLVNADSAEDAVSAATEQSRSLRMYLEAACHLIAPEPWLRTWLAGQRLHDAQMPLLEVMARHLPRRQLAPPGSAAGPGASVLAHEPAGDHEWRPPGPGHREPEVASCPAHLLARIHPDYSFAISADSGCGKTMAAKRIVADAARRALDALRAGPGYRPATVTIPFYLPLGEPPANWDALVRSCIEALPELPGSSLQIGAALEAALTGGTALKCRALVVVDGTHRTHSDDNVEWHAVREFVALIAASPRRRGPGWQPVRASQVVLCGRSESRRHQRAVEALRRERPGWMAAMGLDPLSDAEIDRFVSSLSGRPVPDRNRSRSLVSNPLLLALSVVAGQPEIDSDPADVFDRGINVLLDGKEEHRRDLAEIAFRAASSGLAPVGEFTLADIARADAAQVVADALATRDYERAWVMALDQDERDAFAHAEQETHLVAAAGRGWRFFHDRAFAFLVADRIARCATEQPGREDELFGTLAPHLGDPLWVDTIESTGRLLELRAQAEPAAAPAARVEQG